MPVYLNAILSRLSSGNRIYTPCEENSVRIVLFKRGILSQTKLFATLGIFRDAIKHVLTFPCLASAHYVPGLVKFSHLTD